MSAGDSRQVPFGEYILSFDGTVVEVFGVPQREDPRIHIEQLDRMDFKQKRKKASIAMVGRGVIFGATEKLDASQVAAVQAWVDEVRAAAPKLGG